MNGKDKHSTLLHQNKCLIFPYREYKRHSSDVPSLKIPGSKLVFLLAADKLTSAPANISARTQSGASARHAVWSGV